MDTRKSRFTSGQSVKVSEQNKNYVGLTQDCNISNVYKVIYDLFRIVTQNQYMCPLTKVP